MQSFGFSEHRIHERRWNNNGRMMVSRTLELFGPKAADGRRDQAIFIFDSALDRRQTGQTVGFANECRRQGVSIVGWLPLAQFEHYRRLVGNGDTDLRVVYELRSADDGGYLSKLGLGTEGEILILETDPFSAPTSRVPTAVPLRA